MHQHKYLLITVSFIPDEEKWLAKFNMGEKSGHQFGPYSIATKRQQWIFFRVFLGLSLCSTWSLSTSCFIASENMDL